MRVTRWPPAEWPASRSGPGRVLKQNTGRQAAILRELEATRLRYDGSLAALLRDRRRWEALLSKVARTVEVMPLWRLQVVGRDNLWRHEHLAAREWIHKRFDYSWIRMLKAMRVPFSLPAETGPAMLAAAEQCPFTPAR